ncbi:hypothetical protein [Paenibacillus wynnii]|uniref:hypothetical protein n=1 Tax=Paenibacillus wynnii TaxID=268407 RepID=UPI000689F609|nr:hypothetical protein [Paenibacillus wynnii]
MQTTGNLGLKKPEGTDLVDIADLNGNMDILDTSVNGKVDKVTGKQLSTNDYTAAEKTKLAGIATGANNYTHPNHTGDVTSTGDGVTAIAAGVIVNADVNAAAGIDATKIGTGTVSNAEFGYLDGVTSAIQTQINAKTGIVDYVRQPGYAATAGTLSAYTATLTPAPASLAEGFGITIVPNVTNGASPTLNINGLGAIALKDQKGVAYAAGKLLAGKPYMFRKVGTDFLADSSGGAGDALAGDIRAGKKAATDAGDIVGTLAVQTGGTVTPTVSNIVKPAGIYDTAITVAGVTVPAANVLAGTTIAGTAGTMPNLIGIRNASGVGKWGDGGVAVYPEKGYQKGGAGDGEIKVSVAQLQSINPNLAAPNIRAGYEMFNIVGTLVEGKRTATGGLVDVGGLNSYTVSGLAFRPSVVILEHIQVMWWNADPGLRYVLNTFYTYDNGNEFSSYYYSELFGGYTFPDSGGGVTKPSRYVTSSIIVPSSNGFTFSMSFYVNPSNGYVSHQVRWKAYE